MKHKKGEITEFAKKCANAQHQMLNALCQAEEIVHSHIGNDFNSIDSDLLIEVAKRYAKYAKDECIFDVDTGETQAFQHIIDKIVECCEEHDWFRN